MKKILLIGSSGFIGRNIEEYLKKKGYILDTPKTKDLDATDENKVKEFLKNTYYDVIIHSATDNSSTKTYKDSSNSFYNSLRMFYSFEKNKDLFGKMIYFGSGAEYDKSSDIKNVTEDEFGKTIPKDEYGFAKYIISKNIENSGNIYNLRLFGVFGKYEHWKSKFISNACCKVLKNIPISIRQNVYFDYLWIDDLCEIVEWFINNNPKFNTYNITTGKNIDLLTIANIVNKYNDNNLPIYVCKEGLANEYTSNNDRLLNEMGTFSFTPIEESTKLLFDYYRHNSEDIDIYSLLY